MPNYGPGTDAYFGDAQGLLSARPVPGIPGRLWWAIDTHQLFRDDGATWHALVFGDDFFSMAAAGVPGNLAPASAIVNTFLAAVSAAGGGIVLGDVAGGVGVNATITIPYNVVIFAPDAYAFYWQCITPGVDPMLKITGLGTTNWNMHWLGQINGDSKGVTGVQLMSIHTMLMQPAIRLCTGDGVACQQASQMLVHPYLSGNNCGVAFHGDDAGTGSPCVDVRIIGGHATNIASDFRVVTNVSGRPGAILIEGVSTNCPVISLDIPSGAICNDVTMRDCRWEPSGNCTTGTRVIRCLETNAGPVRWLGGQANGPSSGTKPDYLFELDGFGHVIADAGSFGGYNTNVVKGLAGLRRVDLGRGCEYAGGAFIDTTLVTNKDRLTERQSNASRPSLFMGPASGIPTYGISSDRTVGMFWGNGSPEGVVTAGVGALYGRLDGGGATTLYVKESGTGNVGWVAK